MNFITYFIKCFFYFSFGPFFVFFIILLRPFLHIRIGKLNTSRIGHLSTNTAKYYIYNKLLKKNKCLDLFYCDRIIANNFLLSMWSKKINILPRLFLFSIYKVIISFDYTKKYHYADNNKDGDQDPNRIIERFNPVLEFSKKDLQKGKNILEKMGVDNRKIILFCCRDEGFTNYMQTKNIDLTYHSYRNSNIDNYLLAAEELVKKGYALIRVGTKVKKSIETNSKYIIDYSNSIYRSDFMDIYLQSICYFFISNGSGINEVTRIFKRPILFVNFVPYAYTPTYQSKLICIYKKVFDIRKNKFLSLSDIFKFGIADAYSSKLYIEKKIKLYENTPNEIKDAAIEMLEFIENDFQLFTKDEKKHSSFWSIFYKYKKIYTPYRLGEPESHSMKIGSKFLKDNLYLLD